MGERKGQNLYYPPDYDPTVGGLNKFRGTHALRERARKLHMGILIIRFEMPYNIWCDGCKNHIGMGVRYNAEKTKIGMYYTTPVYQFKMKCHLCNNHFEIKTDPANLDYVIVSGARRQENRWDPTENGQIVPETKETQKRLFDDAMFKLEHKVGDEDVSKQDKPRINRLVGRNESVWKDDYEANCGLRRNFRKRRKELEESAVNDGLLLAKSSLNIHLLPESEDDRNMASLLSLRPSQSSEESQNITRNKILNTPALPSSSGLLTSFGGLKKEESLSKCAPLTRNALGIMVKRKKVENIIEGEINGNESNNLGDKVKNYDEFKYTSKSEAKMETESKNNINNNEEKVQESKSENKEKMENKDQGEVKNNEVSGNNKNEDTIENENIKNSEVKQNISLVCDYSSSGESTD
ncbi:coiled-coil domain-containing protein 130 homolog [Pararge aegeria]|uniref:Jg4816 protein n=1 Tax=Pararge aegeria aegeria TaxID=348720 RepID=A0A8S4S8A9_9NEOP|nr:coiled-coil domain-containing protein 130 homolog [Pararge aegeria]CAH2260110.1 jg4816 [Pararge aegeria aegeria]